MVKLENLREENKDLVLYASLVQNLYRELSKDADSIGLKFNGVFTLAELVTKYKDKNRDFFWICENTNKCGIVATKSVEGGRKISYLYLLPEYRNRGIGTEVLNQIKSKYNTNLTLDIYYDGQAESLYRRFGFKTKYKVLVLE